MRARDSRRGGPLGWRLGRRPRAVPERSALLGCVVGLLLVTCLVAAGETLAGREALWEIGVGGGALAIPDYRGADRGQTLPYPFILPYYRGDLLRSDEQGIRGELVRSERLKLDLSLDGSVPVSASDNPAREGMSDLDPTLQIGPMLRLLLWSQPLDADRSLSLNLSVRAAFAFGSEPRHIGYTAYPNLTYRQDLGIGPQTWRLRLTGGPLWGSGAYHDYFYRVSAAESLAGRPAYDPDPGYAGVRLLGTLYRRHGDLLLNVYALYDSVQGAVFHDSPLVKRDDGFTLGFLVSWFFFKSDRTVETSPSSW